jgi:hypothetical protein
MILDVIEIRPKVDEGCQRHVPGDSEVTIQVQCIHSILASITSC